MTLLQARDGVAEQFIQDVEMITATLLAEQRAARAAGQPVKIGDQSAMMYGTQQRVADRTIVNEVMKQALNSYYAA